MLPGFGARTTVLGLPVWNPNPPDNGGPWKPAWQDALHDALQTIEAIFRGRSGAGQRTTTERTEVPIGTAGGIPPWAWAGLLFLGVVLLVKK